MKNRRLPLLVVLVIVAVACGGGAGETSPTLVGQWERAESTFTSLDGMIIEVQPDASGAIVLTVPDNEFGFQDGDVKWRNIEATGEGDTPSRISFVRKEPERPHMSKA